MLSVFSLQNAVCFIMLTCLVSVLFTFYIQDVLKLKKNNSGSKGLSSYRVNSHIHIYVMLRRCFLLCFKVFELNKTKQ